MSRFLFLGTLFAASILVAPAAPAIAADGRVATEIEYALRHAPGGTQIARNQITWPDGTVLTVESFPEGASSAAASCTPGKFCAYSGLNASGSHLDFATCPSTNGVGALPQVRSISNARSAGTVTGRSGSTIVVTVVPSATKNVTQTIDKVVCA